MRLPFPTRPNVSRGRPVLFGEPVEAKACTGHVQLVIDDTCVYCGKYPRLTIRTTWERRAGEVARG